MSSQDSKSRLLGLGVFLLPLLLVKGTAMFIGQPAPTADASGGHSTTVGVSVIETFKPQWSPEQIGAAHRVEELRGLPFGDSPLLHARKIEDHGPVVPPDRTIIETEPPRVVVQVILRSRRGNVALIGGHSYRIGDEIGETGWIVMEIDPVARSVLIEHTASGREWSLVVPLPR